MINKLSRAYASGYNLAHSGLAIGDLQELPTHQDRLDFVSGYNDGKPDRLEWRPLWHKTIERLKKSAYWDNSAKEAK